MAGGGGEGVSSADGAYGVASSFLFRFLLRLPLEGVI